MSLDESVTVWIDGLRQRDQQADQLQWERYLHTALAAGKVEAPVKHAP